MNPFFIFLIVVVTIAATVAITHENSRSKRCKELNGQIVMGHCIDNNAIIHMGLLH